MILNSMAVNRGVLGVAFHLQMKNGILSNRVFGTVNGVYITNVMSKSAAAEGS
jgi:hypothetical protein